MSQTAWIAVALTGGLGGAVIAGIDAFTNGGATAAVNDTFNALTGRTAQEEEIAQKQKELEYQKDTLLGEMERELELAKQKAEEQAADQRLMADQAEGNAYQDYSQAMQQTYLGQLEAEAELMNLKVSNDRSLGTLAARSGASGVRNTGSVEILQETEAASAAATEALGRKSIDTRLSGSVSQNETVMNGIMQQTNMARSNADQMLAQFDEGSAFMDLYQWKRDRLEGMTDIQTDYLDDVKESLYSWESYATDALNLGKFAGSLFR